MNDLISKADAQVLTSPGFDKIWQRAVDAGLTHEAAYEQTERLHQQVSACGDVKYAGGFRSFMRLHYKVKQKQQSPVA